jgi:hypothetical protein
VTRPAAQRNTLRDLVNRRARVLEAEGRIEPRRLTSPAGSYTRQADDILVEIERDGVRRTRDDALAIARRRDPGATFKRQLVRHYVFGPGGEDGQGMAGRVSTRRRR